MATANGGPCRPRFGGRIGAVVVTETGVVVETASRSVASFELPQPCSAKLNVPTARTITKIPRTAGPPWWRFVSKIDQCQKLAFELIVANCYGATFTRPVLAPR